MSQQPQTIHIEGMPPLSISGLQFTVVPSVMGGAAQVPPLAGGLLSNANADVTLPSLMRLLHEQERRYGNNEPPPVAVRQLPHAYAGPPLQYLLTGRPVKFCNTKEDVLLHYVDVPNKQYWPVPEIAAFLQGTAGNSGIVRARVNSTGHAPSAITSVVADRLGLQRRPLRGPGAVSSVVINNEPVQLELLTEPLTVQLLAGPGNVAQEFTLPAVVVVPWMGGETNHVLFELQLGLFDFCDNVDVDWLPLWASQFHVKASGVSTGAWLTTRKANPKAARWPSKVATDATPDRCHTRCHTRAARSPAPPAGGGSSMWRAQCCVLRETSNDTENRMDSFVDKPEDGGVRLVTQLQCRHTYCVLCLRQFSTNRAFARRRLRCPQCRAEV